MAKRDSSAGETRATRKPASAAARNSERREHERYCFHRGGVPVVVEQPGGGVTNLTVFLRNLSAGGLAFLSKGYLHPGSTCYIVLMRRDGRHIRVNGRIMSCRYLQDSTHEVGIKFDNRIEPSLVLDVSEAEGRTIELAHLRGNILLMDDSKMDQILMAHHMKGSSTELRCVDTMEAGIKRLAEETFDIVVCDPVVGGGDPALVVGKIRKAGFTGPVVVCTAESASDKLAAARASGAESVLVKPYEQRDLLDLMIMLHRATGAVLTTREIYSTLDDNEALQEGLSEFVIFAKKAAEQIDLAMRTDDVPAVRTACLSLKGSSVGFGFAAIGEAARDATAALDVNGGKMGGARPQVRYLALMCRAVALKIQDE